MTGPLKGSYIYMYICMYVRFYGERTKKPKLLIVFRV